MAKKEKRKSDENPKIEKPKEIKGYKVIKAIWIKGVQRHPSYVLTAEDIGFLKAGRTFEHVLKNLKAIEAF